MDITINAEWLVTIITHPLFPLISMMILAILGLLFLSLIFRITMHNYSKRLQDQYVSKQEYVLLALDVPRNNEQGPEAVERMFAYLSGAKGTGPAELPISVEIISVASHIQFLIRIASQFRDLAEAAIYASYPDAEIVEVEDYTKEMPDKFPNDKYDLWGADFTLYNKNAYPIRTYTNFEHTMSGELKDPMIDMLEILGKLQEGEQVWIQIIIKVSAKGTKKESETVIKKIMGEKVKSQKTISEQLINIPIEFLQAATIITPPTAGSSSPEKQKTVSPGERKIIEAIQNKASKISFETKMRIIYIAEKEVFNKSRGVIGVLGALNTVNTLDMNGLMPDKTAKTLINMYETSKSSSPKQTAIMAAYKKRGGNWKIESQSQKDWKKFLDFLTISSPSKKDILNIEELATLYHFPVIASRVPLVKKTGSKRGEPPFSLPTK
ncbi:MAG: hypothetical protein PHF10_01570 [Patescibacteria group bacterium]|nr:hypothetical protein [Patescibacteria group bacterium]MDD5534417.1 hypothetical protein [Patescibacteria group bacterium]